MTAIEPSIVNAVIGRVNITHIDNAFIFPVIINRKVGTEWENGIMHKIMSLIGWNLSI